VPTTYETSTAVNDEAPSLGERLLESGPRAIPLPEDQPTMSVPAAGKALGLSRSSAYAAAQRGEIPTIAIGSRFVVPTAALRRLVGLDAHIGDPS
jgi:hypothetical protein